MVNLTSEPRPEWLSDDLLKTCIRNSQKLPTNTDLYLDEIFVTYVVPKGENYMSVMYRVKVPYRAGFRSNKVEELTVIMKVEHGNFSDVTPFAFERETEMYRDIIPQWHDKLEKKKMDTKFICRYIHYVKVEDSSILVLEDIKLLEYEVADRTKGLDRNHCKFLLRKLAKMHAASMTYCHDQNIGISNAYRKSPFFAFDENETSAANIKTNAKKKIAGILEILGKYPTKYQRAIKFFEEIEDSFVTRKNFTDMLPYKEGNKFNTIIHGDCWINNIMFKYAADSSLEDVLFVDFQASYYTSIAYDFMYFMFSSVSLEVRRSHFGELKNFYFNSLAKDLKALEYGGEMPTLEDYDKELQRAIRVAIFSLMTLLPICLAKLDSQSLSREDSDALSLDEISSIMGTVSDETLWTKLVLASSDIIIKEKLIDAFVA